MNLKDYGNPMTWNYRIIRRKHDNGEITFGVHEVYTRGEKLDLWSSEPTPPVAVLFMN